LAEPFSFTKGCSVMKIKARPDMSHDAHRFGTLLFDVVNDPGQIAPLEDKELESRLERLLIRLMKENDAPPEQYERLGLLP